MPRCIASGTHFMTAVSDFTESETWMVETTLKQRWPGQNTDLQLADVEIKMYPDDRELSEVPNIFWQIGDATMSLSRSVIIATATSFHRGYQQYGTGKSEFDDISDCLDMLLQVHADKEAMSREETEQK